MNEVNIPRDPVELERELQEQIFLLESSLINFDQGQLEEGKRIAASLRILLHDTKCSRSLLGQLDVKDKLWFFDVAWKYDGKNLLSEDLLLNMLAPRLFTSATTPVKRFDEWWDRQVVLSTGGMSPTTYTRKQIILFLANQDGGAHVDPSLNRDYFDMTRNNKHGWFLVDGETDIPMSNDRIKLSVRTIAFEVCVTLYSANKSLRFRLIHENPE